jgi:PadR family transcriptional regulator, regulatory protein AphA
MSIRHAILGYLSWKPFTGYELKKLFSDALSFHWSGNNNQIYGSLVALHKEGLVSIEVQQQEKYPARKVYTMTEAGREELRTWLLSEPELPAFRSLAHTQLAWAELLSDEELDGLLASYERQLSDQALMCREAMRRGLEEPRRSEREALIWKSIDEKQASFYEGELAWTRKLRTELAALAARGAGREGRNDVD